MTRLAALHPLAVSVTWGAGGSTKERSLDLASFTQSNGMDTILHLTCTNMMQGTVDEALRVRGTHYLHIEFSRSSRKRKPAALRIYSLSEEVGISPQLVDDTSSLHATRPTKRGRILDPYRLPLLPCHRSRQIHPLIARILLRILHRRGRFYSRIISVALL